MQIAMQVLLSDGEFLQNSGEYIVHKEDGDMKA
jgi:hypothetical protein